MKVNEKIKALRKQKGLSQQELAELVGFKTASAINKIELGLRDINQAKIKAFAEALEVSPAYLFDDSETENSDFGKKEEEKVSSVADKNVSNDTSSNISFPILYDISIENDEIKDISRNKQSIEIPAAFLKSDKSNYSVIEVGDDSMAPDYREGDKIIFKKQNELEFSGQIAIIAYNRKAIIKRIYFVGNEDRITLSSINRFYPSERVNADKCKVLGVPYLVIRNIE